MNQITLTTKKIGDIRGEFIIPSYQRGYRWKEEVKMLLDDINEIPCNSSYCLQPIVIKTIGSNKYELIDGQQRLTSLYLLLKFIRTYRPKMDLKFTIDYEIRKNSKSFLLSLDFDNFSDNATNIDEYFITEAAKTIADWFGNQSDADNAASLMLDKLNNWVNIIWYEIDSSENAISLFTRLNIGKIPLTNAELVKAIFLSRNNGIDERYQLEISTQWDSIENEMHNDNFWYFITNHDEMNFPTRIELLFDIMAHKNDSDKERLRTFFWFSDQIKSKYKANKIDLWKKVIETFQRLKEWHNESELYHKVGYLIAENQISLPELMSLSDNMGKIAFRQHLNQLIADSIYNEGKEYTDLSYDNPYHKNFIERLLLLFNIESVFQNGDKSMRFPFDKHKNKRGGWSLEHIHAQQSEGLNKRDQWNEWLDLHTASLNNIDANRYQDLVKIIEERDRENLRQEEFVSLFNQVISALQLEQDVTYIHTLSNMALLGKDDNATLNNSTFDVKRDKIIEMDKKGDYIPLCTRRVFLKYYTPSDKNQLHFWGKEDRDAYLKHILETLNVYTQLIAKEA